MVFRFIAICKVSYNDTKEDVIKKLQEIKSNTWRIEFEFEETKNDSWKQIHIFNIDYFCDDVEEDDIDMFEAKEIAKNEKEDIVKNYIANWTLIEIEFEKI